MNKIVWYALMYFLLGFLPPVGALFSEYAEHDQWPSWPRITSVLILALVAGIGGLRGFFDGTVQRHNDAAKNNGEALK